MTAVLPQPNRQPLRPPLLTRPGELREILGISFTDEQLLAACAPLEPGVIVAGAGSGKTSVMAARVVWLVGTGQVASDRVLGLTFTAKAAGELASRITRALDQAGLTGEAAAVTSQSGVLVEPALPAVSTYHAFAARLYTENALRLGMEPGARLLADATRFQLAARVLRRHREPLHHLTSPLRMLIGDLVALEGELSEHLRSPAELLAFEAEWIARLVAEINVEETKPKPLKGQLTDLRKFLEQSEKRVELTRLAAELRAAKRTDHLIDFADQVAFGAQLAEGHRAVGIAERQAAGVVLLDEYQDTSIAQRRMLAALFGGGHPVTAVGDPCQAIYGWRGASVSNLDSFPEHFPRADGSAAATYSLAVNQRSGGRLLKLANRLTESVRARHRVVELTAPAGKEELGETVLSLHETYPEELAWVAGRIADCVARGVPPGNCAVLVRVRSDFPALRDALTAAGVPVEVVGLGGLLALPEIRDLVSVLQVMADPTANAALVRLLSGPRWRLGLRDIAALGTRARDHINELSGAPARSDGEADAALHDDLLTEAAAGADPADLIAISDALLSPGSRLSPEGAARARALGQELRELRRYLGEPLLELVHRVLGTTGLAIEIDLADDADGGRRWAALDAFLDVVAGFTDLEGQSSLSAFLAFLDAAEEHDRGLDISTPSGADAVQVMTVHKAKGLEWDVVALPNLTAKVFPNDTLLGRRWVRAAKMLPGPLRGDHLDIPELRALERSDLTDYDARSRVALDIDERRLGYVALTRARNTLIASSHWWGPTQSMKRGPSEYLLGLQRDAAEAQIDVWVAETSFTANPVTAGQEARVWPVPADRDLLGRRLAAAEAVSAERVALSGDALFALPAEPLTRRRDGGLADGGLADAGFRGAGLRGAGLRGAGFGDAGFRGAGFGDAGLDDAEVALFADLDEETELLLEAELRDRAATRLVPLPVSLSASQLVALRSDPDGLARALARPLPRKPVIAARRGTRFHAWVETLWDQVPLLGAEELTGAGDDELNDEKLAALQAAFLAGDYAARKPFALESPFSLPLAGRIVIGRIDAVFDLGDGRFEVVDWKTGTEAADPIQLAVYRLAWARLQGIEVDAVDAAFVYVATGRVARPELLDEAGLTALLAFDLA